MNTDKQVERLKTLIIARLRTVIDPETGADVVRMRLVEDITVNLQGEVSYIFRPSSPFCPIAVYLVQQIKQAISYVPGVASQKIKVKDYVAAEELTKLINQE